MSDLSELAKQINAELTSAHTAWEAYLKHLGDQRDRCTELVHRCRQGELTFDEMNKQMLAHGESELEACEDFLEHSKNAGVLLLCAKERCRQGQWPMWLSHSACVSAVRAQECMELATDVAGAPAAPVTGDKQWFLDILMRKMAQVVEAAKERGSKVVPISITSVVFEAARAARKKGKHKLTALFESLQAAKNK
jgi:hypothetical protein